MLSLKLKTMRTDYYPLADRVLKFLAKVDKAICILTDMDKNIKDEYLNEHGSQFTDELSIVSNDLVMHKLIEYVGTNGFYVTLRPEGKNPAKNGFAQYLNKLEENEHLDIESKKAQIKGTSIAKKGFYVAIILGIIGIAIALYQVFCK